jgi:dTMP kinase
VTAPRGKLIALEGIDGCGKSTQARLLAASLDAVSTFEPGATEVGGRLRELVLHAEGAELQARTEALIMAADRAEHVAQLIAPTLAAGRWVVTDRYSGSTLAYQGAGRGLDMGELATLVVWATGGLEADLSVLVEVPVAVARARIAGTRPDRLEGLDASFHERVHEGFLAQVAAAPDRWAVVDGSGPPETVAAAVAAAVHERLGDPGGGGGR